MLIRFLQYYAIFIVTLSLQGAHIRAMTNEGHVDNSQLAQPRSVAWVVSVSPWSPLSDDRLQELKDHRDEICTKATNRASKSGTRVTFAAAKSSS